MHPSEHGKILVEKSLESGTVPLPLASSVVFIQKTLCSELALYEFTFKLRRISLIKLMIVKNIVGTKLKKIKHNKEYGTCLILK